MHWLKVRMVVFGALAVWACSGDPTNNQGTPTAITASPDIVFVTQGDSQPVIVSVVDEDGQILEADFTATDVGAGISAVEDPTFLSLTSANQIRRQARFYVKAFDLTATSFVVNALGLSRTIQVTSIPGTLNATITDSLPALGDTVSITAPAGTFFSDSSVLTFGGAAPVVVTRDAATITFIPFPNLFGPAVVSNVGVTSNPAVVFSLPTPFSVRTDSILDIGAGVTPTSPALGGTVTLTLPTDLRLLPESLATLNIANQPVLPRDATISADSTTITFVPPPNADSFVVLSGVVHRNLPQYPLTLNTTTKVTTPVIDSIPASISTTTPAANQSVTLNVTDGSFALNPDATVSVGADVGATVLSQSTTSITFVPTPGATGNVGITGVTVAGFSLTLPSTTPSITVGALATTAGTGDQATAPTIPVPAVGERSTFFDLPDFGTTPDHFYKFVAPAAGDYTITTNWDIGSDIDQFVCDSPVTLPGFDNCDFAAATGNQPESATYTLTAGTHFIVLDDFGADAAGATIHITVER